MMKGYFQMGDRDKQRYQYMIAKSVQSKWQNSVIYGGFEESYEKWLNKYLESLEQSDQFEQLQAFIDYHKNENKSPHKL